jgi:hypothetical protein
MVSWPMGRSKFGVNFLLALDRESPTTNPPFFVNALTRGLPRTPLTERSARCPFESNDP